MIRLDNACRQCGEAADRITDGLCWMCAPSAVDPFADAPAYDVLSEYRGLPGGLNGPSSNTGLNASVGKRQRDVREAALQTQRDRATSAQAAAQRELAAVAARATALEAQLGELHKTLAASNRTAASPPRRPTARRPPKRG